MKITACYIVKNEGRNLGRSISSLKEQVDEIIVVDTGSADDTTLIAERHGACVYEFPWRDDFSMARNFALGKVQAAWVVFPDGDEYFSPATAGNLRRVIQEADDRGKDLLLVPWHNIDEISEKVLLDSYAPRIFRCRPEFRYEGRIHEELRNCGHAMENIGIVSPEELVLVHTGYSAEVSKEKAERNARLLLQELEETKEPGNLYMYLAESYDGLGDASQAVKYARMDIAMGRRNVVYASRSWRILLRYLASDPSAREERLAFAGRAVRDFPELPEFHAEYAECLAENLDFSGAVREAGLAGRAFLQSRGKNGIEPVMFDGRMLEDLERRCEGWKRISVRSQELRVTSCLIVRNAERDMGSWLENTMRFSEERIVVDTGSEDRTRDMAVSAGCTVQEFSWTQDFSAARNAALSHATGDWISVMDADEAYEKPEQVKPFLAWIEERHPEAEAVIVPLVNVDEDAADREMGRDMVLRFVRNGRGLRYEGNVHEQLCRFDGSEPCIFQERQRALLRHWGYSSRRVFAKAQRNLELLEEDIALHGEGPRHYRYLADCFSTLGNWEKTAFYARKAIAAPLQSVVPDSRMQHLLLAALRKLDAPFSEQEEAAREMCNAFPEKPEFPGLLGILLAEQGKEKEAVPLLETALELAEQADAKGLPTDFSDDVGTVCAWLALAYENCGRKEEGGVLLEKALRFSPQEDDVLNAAREIKKGLFPEEFFRWLAEWIPDSVESALFLARWAERNGHADLLSHVRGQMDGVYHRSLPREDFYEEAFAGRAEPLGEKATAGLVQDIPFLLKAMLLVEQEKEPGWQDLLRQCREVLPDALRNAWLAFEGQQESFSEEGFRIFWPIVRNTGDHVQKERFAMLSFGLGEHVWRPLAAELMADGSWEAAFALFGRIPADSPQADGTFWHDLGVCLWHMGEGAFAECFERARSLGCDRKDMEAFEQWRREDGLQ